MTARVRHVIPPARATWRLELLGGATLIGVNGERAHLERKTAGVLALLALEGEVLRSRVAGLLWADTDEERARGNLRQCLHRLKKLSAADLVHSGERLAVTAALEVDTVTLESRAFLGDDAGLIAVRGEILEGLDFEDCPEFTDWLLVQRERWRGARGGAYRRALQDPSNPQALVWAREWVNLEPISEEAHRVLARALDAQHNRAQALQILRDFETLLRHELGVAPSNETRALRESLERDEPAAHPQPTTLPRDVLSPPRLVGRAREWAQLERAWATGVNIVVRGAPGVGKSRFVLDFVATKTRFDSIEARPGDANVPMAAFARTLRQLLPDPSAFDLPTWVETELSRLLPELNHAAPPPMTTEADKLRFFEALFVVTERRFLQGVKAIVIDDLQFMDAASFEALRFNAERERRLGVRTVTVYRSGELSPELEALVETDAASGAVQIIDLNPLEADALSDLVGSLKLETPDTFTAQLQQRTGGNPLYALETIRALLEQNALRDDLETLPVPALVRQITAQRLERRSPGAQRVAQVAAVAGTDFTLELAAFALDAHPLDLQGALSELEDAQIMRGERFQHDLLLEGVLNAIGSSVRRFLHRRCAEFLEESGDPARIATHWLEGGDEARAIPWWLRATDDAQRRYRLQEASEFAERAGYALERLGHTDDAFDALERAVNHRVAFDLTGRLETLADALFRLARTDAQRMRAWLARTRVLNAWQFAAKAEDAARQGLKLEAKLSPMTNADLHTGLAEALWRQERHAEAITAMRPALETYAALGDTTRLAQTEGRLGIIHGDSEDHGAARDHLRRSVALLEDLGDDFGAAKSRNMLGITLGRIGLVRDALEQHQLVRVFCERAQGAQVLNRMNLANMGQRFFDLDRYEEALEITRWAVATLEPEMGWARAYSQTHQVRIKLRLGATQHLEDELRHILEVPGLRDDMRFDALLLEAMLHVHQQREPQARGIFDELRAQLRPDTRPFKRIELYLAAAQLEPSEVALELAQTALELTQRFQLNGLRIAALTRTAQIHARLGDLERAVQHTGEACELLNTFDCTNFYRAEVWWTHAQLLRTLESPDATPFLHRLVNWVLEKSSAVSSHHREAFLNANPVNRAILETAQASGLNLDL